MKSSYKKIGNYITTVSNRNTELNVNNLMGINIEKFFMPSVANTVGTNMSKYKIVKNGQFACNRMHVGRDKRLPVALWEGENNIIVSPAYDVFEIMDTEALDPYYFMMWLLRKEFDRNAWFYTDADVRGGLKWEDFCNLQLPVPSIMNQRKIVKEYKVVEDRIKLNTSLIQKLEEASQAIYKYWFVDFQFPDENGKPYKLNGGEMEYNQELDMEIPKGWGDGTLENILVLNYGKALASEARMVGSIKVYSSAGQYGYCNKALVNEPSIIVGRKGSIGTIFYETEPMYCIDTAYFIKESDCKFPLIFTFALLRTLDLSSMNEDSAVPGLNRNTVYAIKTIIPKENVVSKYTDIFNRYNGLITSLTLQNKKLIEFKEILLSKITMVGV